MVRRALLGLGMVAGCGGVAATPDAGPCATPATWYQDADGDGAGDPTSSQAACAQPAGFVADDRDCNDQDAAVHPGIPSCPIETDLDSCAAVLAAGDSEGDGAYRLALGAAPVVAWCDMTTDGGGWTALLGPAAMPTALLADVTVTTAQLAGTGDTCASPVTFPVSHGWYGARYRRCGDLTTALRLSWSNPIAATDAMVLANAQGSSATLTVDGATIAADAEVVDPEGSACRFWNDTGATTTFGQNLCFESLPDAPPRVLRARLDGPFTIELVSGPAGQPSGAYSAGQQLQRVFVR
ncbi:MAG: fibrinogen-like YCDxxxxGGGW domain-containing protein [Kofleriaceae bacterium]